MLNLKSIVLLCAVAVVASAQPAIYTNGIVNAASASPVGLPNSSIAQGSIFSIYGTNMGPASSPALSWPLQTTLGGVSVAITPASGPVVQAIMLFVSPGQINALLPSATPVGAATARVTYNGQTSAGAAFTVIKSSLGVFAVNAAGSGPGIIQNWIATGIPPLNTIATSAAVGQPAVLYGTGLGPVTGNEAAGPPTGGDLRSSIDTMELWVGGSRVNIEYAGRSGNAGLDQINFTAPNTPGCYVPVTVKIGNVVSNTTTMAIATGGGMCSDTVSFSGLSADQLQANGLRQGYVQLTKSTTRISVGGFNMDTTTENASGGFTKYNWAQLIGTRGQFGVSTYGACTVLTFRGETAPTADIITPTMLDAGASLALTTPAVTLASASKGVYGSALTLGYLGAGTYTVTGPGGADVGAFTSTLTLPTPLTWSNSAAITSVDRTAGVTVTWTGGTGYVRISGMSAVTTPQTAGAMFTCLQQASAGQFAVPSVVLLALPASDVGMLIVDNEVTPAKFTATGLDTGSFGASFVTSIMVPYR